MTIIKPHQYRGYILFFALIFTIILAGGAIYIFEYNVLVDTRFQLKAMRQEIIDLQAVNADFKNNLYGAVDPGRLEALAADRGLILERNPS